MAFKPAKYIVYWSDKCKHSKPFIDKLRILLQNEFSSVVELIHIAPKNPKNPKGWLAELPPFLKGTPTLVVDGKTLLGSQAFSYISNMKPESRNPESKDIKPESKEAQIQTDGVKSKIEFKRYSNKGQDSKMAFNLTIVKTRKGTLCAFDSMDLCIASTLNKSAMDVNGVAITSMLPNKMDLATFVKENNVFPDDTKTEGNAKLKRLNVDWLPEYQLGSMEEDVNNVLLFRVGLTTFVFYNQLDPDNNIIESCVEDCNGDSLAAYIAENTISLENISNVPILEECTMPDKLLKYITKYLTRFKSKITEYIVDHNQDYQDSEFAKFVKYMTALRPIKQESQTAERVKTEQMAEELTKVIDRANELEELERLHLNNVDVINGLTSQIKAISKELEGPINSRISNLDAVTKDNSNRITQFESKCDYIDDLQKELHTHRENKDHVFERVDKLESQLGQTSHNNKLLQAEYYNLRGHHAKTPDLKKIWYARAVEEGCLASKHHMAKTIYRSQYRNIPEAIRLLTELIQQKDEFIAQQQTYDKMGIKDDLLQLNDIYHELALIYTYEADYQDLQKAIQIYSRQEMENDKEAIHRKGIIYISNAYHTLLSKQGSFNLASIANEVGIDFLLKAAQMGYEKSLEKLKTLDRIKYNENQLAALSKLDPNFTFPSPPVVAEPIVTIPTITVASADPNPTHPENKEESKKENPKKEEESKTPTILPSSPNMSPILQVVETNANDTSDDKEWETVESTTPLKDDDTALLLPK